MAIVKRRSWLSLRAQPCNKESTVDGGSFVCKVASRGSGFTTKGLSSSFSRSSSRRRKSSNSSYELGSDLSITGSDGSTRGGSSSSRTSSGQLLAVQAFNGSGSATIRSLSNGNYNITWWRATQQLHATDRDAHVVTASAGTHHSSSSSSCKVATPASPAKHVGRPASVVTVTAYTATMQHTPVTASHTLTTRPSATRIRCIGRSMARGFRSLGASICIGLGLNARAWGTEYSGLGLARSFLHNDAALHRAFAGAWCVPEAGIIPTGFHVYRAKFITGTVQELKSKPGGGAAWLMSLRTVPFAEAVEALCTLPGVGPKVAACICLFSLDKHDAIPVDTHVWQLATRYYAPQLAGKALTPKLHGVVQEVFVERFGPYAGWAHHTLFISELASHRGLLPEQLRSPLKGERRRSTGGGKRRSSSAGLAGDVTGDAGAGDAVTGKAVAGGRGKRRSSSVGAAGNAAAGSASDTALASPTADGTGGSAGKRRRRSSGGVGGGAAAQAAMLAAADSGDAAADATAVAVVGAAGSGGAAGAGTDEPGVGSQLEQGSQALRRGSRARKATKRAVSQESDGDRDEGDGVAIEGQLGSQAGLGGVTEEEPSAPGTSKRRRKRSSDA